MDPSRVPIWTPWSTVTTRGGTSTHGRDPRGDRRALEQLNLPGTRVHGAFLIGTKVTDAFVHSLDLSGNIRSLVVNGVEVAEYVDAELERRHPELGYLGSRDVPGMRRAWAKVQEIAAATLATARRLPPAMLARDDGS